jgi:hypothetical protein
MGYVLRVFKNSVNLNVRLLYLLFHRTPNKLEEMFSYTYRGNTPRNPGKTQTSGKSHVHHPSLIPYPLLLVTENQMLVVLQAVTQVFS